MKFDLLTVLKAACFRFTLDQYVEKPTEAKAESIPQVRGSFKYSPSGHIDGLQPVPSTLKYSTSSKSVKEVNWTMDEMD